MDFSSTEDLDTIINFIHKRYPIAPIYLVGYSMGTIQAMNWLGKHSGEIACPVKGFVSISSPVDLAKASPHLSNQKVYAYFMTKSLIRIANFYKDLVQDKGGLGINYGKL